jgi:hypothetical protein
VNRALISETYLLTRGSQETADGVDVEDHEIQYALATAKSYRAQATLKARLTNPQLLRMQHKMASFLRLMKSKPTPPVKTAKEQPVRLI